MIGNQADAILAHDNDVAAFSIDGSARNVYLINGVIYKVEIEEFANAAEFANLFELSTIIDVPGIAIPEYAAYDVEGSTIIAMEFIDGTALYECNCSFIGVKCECESDRLIPADIVSHLERFGMTDLAYGNIILRNGIYYIVDADLLTSN